MPIVSGGTGAAGGGATILFDATLLAPAASIDTGANGIAQTAKHLRVYVRAGSAAVATADTVAVTFNNDATATYQNNFANNHAGGWSGSEHDAATPTAAATFAIAGSTASNPFGIAVFDVVDYTAASVNQLALGLFEYTISNINHQNGVGSLLWTGNAAVTRMKFATASGSNLITGTRVTVVGF